MALWRLRPVTLEMSFVEPSCYPGAIECYRCREPFGRTLSLPIECPAEIKRLVKKAWHNTAIISFVEGVELYRRIDGVLRGIGEFPPSFPGVEFGPYVWKRSSIAPDEPVLDCSSTLVRNDVVDQIVKCGLTGLTMLPTVRPRGRSASHTFVEAVLADDHFLRDQNFDPAWNENQCPVCNQCQTAPEYFAYQDYLVQQRLIPSSFVVEADFFQYIVGGFIVSDRARAMFLYFGMQASQFEEMTVVDKIAMQQHV